MGCAGVCWYSNTFEPSGMKMLRTGKASTALAFSAERKAGHRRAFIEIMQPGGECRSAHKGASQDLNSRLRLVAQMSSPRTCSKSFLLILFDRSRACSCSFSSGGN